MNFLHNDEITSVLGDIPTSQICNFLHEYFDFFPTTFMPLRGYSNRNYLISDKTNRQAVLRIARSNRTPESIFAEEHILSMLKQFGFDLAPKLLQPGKQGSKLQVQGKEHYLHLFEKIPGNIDCLWWEQCGFQKLKQIFSQLANLHIAMAAVPRLPTNENVPRCYDFPEHAPTCLNETDVGKYVLQNWSAFYQKSQRLQEDMANAFHWSKAHYQWIHGDIQLENVLFDADRLTAFLDFEFARWDACEKDVILSAFRVTKEGPSDNPFEYDKQRFEIAVHTYLRENTSLCHDFFNHFETLWKPYFCLDQANVYLVNAFDGIWKLEKSIGLLPCFNEVLAYRGVHAYV